MKRLFAVTLTLIVVLAFLAAGCAKKPVPTAEAPVAEERPVVSAMPSQEISGIQERAITEEDAAAAAARAAAMALPQLQRIHFDFDQHVLTDQAREILAANAAYLRANPGVRVQVEGHCDERGSDEYNLALGERRARAAMSYLVSLGIPQDRLSFISYGEERPLDSARNEDAWAKNRRAEFTVMR
jgi:peptidoglycan-associated lipoprotein